MSIAITNTNAVNQRNSCCRCVPSTIHSALYPLAALAEDIVCSQQSERHSVWLLAYPLLHGAKSDPVSVVAFFLAISENSQSGAHDGVVQGLQGNA